MDLRPRVEAQYYNRCLIILKTILMNYIIGTLRK